MARKILIGSVAFRLAFLAGGLMFLGRAQCGGIVHGRTNDGGGPFFSSECTYGSQWIIRTVEVYSDPAKAETVFAERVRTGETVYEQNDKVDRSARTIGRRAVISLRVSETGQTFTSILWTDEKRIVSIDSTLHFHALFLEWIDDK